MSGCAASTVAAIESTGVIPEPGGDEDVVLARRDVGGEAALRRPDLDLVAGGEPVDQPGGEQPGVDAAHPDPRRGALGRADRVGAALLAGAR